MQIQQLDHITITSKDPKRSVAFYRDVLGLKPEYEWPGEITMLKAGNASIAIGWWEKGKAPEQQPPITVHHFAFRVDTKTFENAKKELPAKGVKIESIEDHGNCMSLYFRDPDNHYLELTCYELKGSTTLPKEF